MFRVSDTAAQGKVVEQVESNYVIQKSDLLQLEVFTNKGERIVDPQFAINENTQAPVQSPQLRNYLVDANGLVKFPLIDTINVAGMRIREAEEILQKQYSKYYQEPFVTLNYANKRVVVLGASGGTVVPLTNENVRLTEVLALSKSVTDNSKVGNIRVLRGNEVYVADLSTFEGYRQGNLILQPNDIVYVEPIRRPVIEAIRDYSPFFSIIAAITTLIVVLEQSNNN